jgi:hypothetical protein
MATFDGGSVFRRQAVAVVVFLFVAISGITLAVENPKPLTNSDVVSMVQAGLPESTVVMAIKQSPVGFDTAPMTLIDLKKQGISPAILEAMMQAQSGSASAPGRERTGNPLLDAYADSQLQTAESAQYNEPWLEQNGKKVPLHRAATRIDVSMGQVTKQVLLFSPKSKYLMVIDSAKSKTRLSGSPSAVYFRSINTGLGGACGVVKLTAESDKNRRRVGITSMVWTTATKFSPPECEIQGTVEDVDGGMQKITFSEPLAPGEYGLVVGMGMVYDFAVD